MTTPEQAAAQLVPPRVILTDGVYDAVKTLIMDGRIPPSARVNMDQLARALKVSATPLREALARLESEGLVTKEPLRGYSTTPLLTRSEFDDLYELRQLVEPALAASAATRASPEDHVELAAEMARCPDAPPELGDYRTYRALFEHDVRLHDLIARIAGNQVARQALRRLHSHLHAFRLHGGNRSGDCTRAEHAKVVDAVCLGDPHAAASAMSAHLRTARHRAPPFQD
ncbi:MAG TPA: GntR family transcriptional regulator [Pseudonocardia sp.]|jgi:DNA-binding GntR family transcriptional regulator|uniref:GntR family transcriptional regulator n=1 Tax=Pseudonocardia sp. TaxID=60912 RepID=UPI002BB09371|nr:GntR family transcriptional regulator [Pseudonocardia sp.]HTF49599.1 GntR family transcriptional regulator [Pseudonocardia sp.]